MSTYLQYHNGARLGWVPLGALPFLETHLAIWTRSRQVTKAVGGVIYLVVSLPRPKRYYLWERFEVTAVQQEGEDFCAHGPGWQLAPPQRLDGEAFAEFRRACANFVGFRRIDHLPYATTLADLARRHRHAQLGDEVARFCDDLVAALPDNGDARYARGFVRRHVGLRAEAAADFEDALRLGTEFATEAAALRGMAAAGVTVHSTPTPQHGPS